MMASLSDIDISKWGVDFNGEHITLGAAIDRISAMVRDQQAARISSLESQLREREAEAAGFDAEIKRLARERDEDGLRAESAEAALAKLRDANAAAEEPIMCGHRQTDWDHEEEVCVRCALAAAREEVEQLEEVITSAAVALGMDKAETNDPHCLANEIAHQFAAAREENERLRKESAEAFAEWLTKQTFAYCQHVAVEPAVALRDFRTSIGAAEGKKVSDGL